MFVEKVRDIVGLYLNPPDKAIVLCIDEKSQTQALERSQPPFCHCVLVCPSVRPMITCATGLFLCLPLTMRPPGEFWADATSVIATRNSWPFCNA
jgi:hypothetical protein